MAQNMIKTFVGNFGAHLLEKLEETKSAIKELSGKQVLRRAAIKIVVIAGHQFATILPAELTRCSLCKDMILLDPKSPIDSLRHAQCQLCKLTVHSSCAQKVDKYCVKSSMSNKYDHKDIAPPELCHNFKSSFSALWKVVCEPIAFCDQCGTSIISLNNRLECDRKMTNGQKCEMKVHTYCKDSICYECPHKSTSQKITLPNKEISGINEDQVCDDRQCKSKKLPKKLDQYEILDYQLGEGSFSKIYLVKLRMDNNNNMINNNKLYAMKIVDKANVSVRNDPDSSRLEWKILEMGREYPFLAAGSCCFQTKTKLIYLLEHGPGGDLLYQLEWRLDNNRGPFSEDDVRFYAAEIILALTFLHKRHIVYRDLKPENVILDERGHCKLIDFGMAKNLSLCPNMKTNTFCGTQFYLSPEMIAGLAYSYSVDWWALGVSMYELLFGRLPFYDQSNNYNELIRNSTVEFPPRSTRDNSRDVVDLLQRLLDKNPELRLGCQIVEGSEQAIKTHPFFANAQVSGQFVAQTFWQAIADRTIPPPPFQLRHVPSCSSDNHYYNNSNNINIHRKDWSRVDSKNNSISDHDFDNFSQYGESFQDDLLI